MVKQPGLLVANIPAALILLLQKMVRQKAKRIGERLRNVKFEAFILALYYVLNTLVN